MHCGLDFACAIQKVDSRLTCWGQEYFVVSPKTWALCHTFCVAISSHVPSWLAAAACAASFFERFDAASDLPAVSAVSAQESQVCAILPDDDRLARFSGSGMITVSVDLGPVRQVETSHGVTCAIQKESNKLACFIKGGYTTLMPPDPIRSLAVFSSEMGLAEVLELEQDRTGLVGRGSSGCG